MDIIAQLSKELGKDYGEVREFIIDAAKKYKVYTIPKRTHGHRVIAQPAKELKRYQSALLKLIDFPVHPCAMAYRKGLSIRDNALVHCEQRYLLKMDLSNFFNSITPELFWNSCRLQDSDLISLPQNQKLLIEQLLFWCPSKKTNGKLVLSIGAPSSPMISNYCLNPFDQRLQDDSQALGVFYTRYADDLTFSTNEVGVLAQVTSLVQTLLQQYFGALLRVNHDKTVFSSKAHNRHVTGITITNEAMLSLGRKRKRYIKHLVHQFCLTKLDVIDCQHLAGLLSFASYIEPKFIVSLNNKYGSELIESLLKANYE